MTTRTRKIRRATALAIVLAVAAGFPATSAQAADTQVKIDNFTFGPKELKVKAGTTVTWTNEDDIPHTVVSPNKPRTRAAACPPPSAGARIISWPMSELGQSRRSDRASITSGLPR